MKLAITGSNGFVGSYAVQYFAPKHEIIAFQRQKYEIQKNITYKKWDLRDAYNGPFDCDIFIHAAADTGYEKSRSQMMDHNVTSNKNVLDIVNASHCKHFIYVSSSSVYQGISGIIDENAEILENNLINSYSASKYFAEEYIKANLRPDIKLTILRPRAIYGIGDRVLEPNILKHQIFGKLILLGNGKNRTSLTDINYFIKSIETVILKQESAFEIYNIADEENKTMQENYEEVVKKYSLKGIIHVPLWILKALYFINSNKISYILDSFEKDKILDTGKFNLLQDNS